VVEAHVDTSRWEVAHGSAHGVEQAAPSGVVCRHRQPAAMGGRKLFRRQRCWWSTAGPFSQTCQVPGAIYPERAGNGAWGGGFECRGM
jgi:hypothetical protein